MKKDDLLEVRSWGDPEFVGQFPARTELTVLPADEPKERQLGFTIREYLGCEVYENVTGPITADTELKPVTDKNAMVEGAEFITQGLFGFVRFTVHLDEYGVPHGKAGEGLGVCLAYDTDDRHCWTSCGMYNTRALGKLGLKR